MTIQYLVWKKGFGEITWLRIDERRVHWYESRKAEGTRFSLGKAQTLAKQLQREARSCGTFSVYGYEKED